MGPQRKAATVWRRWFKGSLMTIFCLSAFYWFDWSVWARRCRRRCSGTNIQDKIINSLSYPHCVSICRRFLYPRILKYFWFNITLQANFNDALLYLKGNATEINVSTWVTPTLQIKWHTSQPIGGAMVHSIDTIKGGHAYIYLYIFLESFEIQSRLHKRWIFIT